MLYNVRNLSQIMLFEGVEFFHLKTVLQYVLILDEKIYFSFWITLLKQC